MARFQYQPLTEPPFNTTAAPSVPDLSWAPTYPERIRRASSAAALAGAFVGVFALAQLPVPANAWAPSYPDRIASKPRALQGHQDASAAVRADAAPPTLSWAPTYPARLETRAALQRAWTDPVAALRADAPSVPALSWQVSYPDRLSRPRALQGRAEATAALWWPAPGPLTWQAEHPDQVSRLRSLPAHEQLSHAYVPALGQLAVPSLSWSPFYPTVIPTLKPRAASGGASWPEREIAPDTITIAILSDVVMTGTRFRALRLEPAHGLAGVALEGSGLQGVEVNPAQGLSGVAMRGSGLSDVELIG